MRIIYYSLALRYFIFIDTYPISSSEGDRVTPETRPGEGGRWQTKIVEMLMDASD